MKHEFVAYYSSRVYCMQLVCHALIWLKVSHRHMSLFTSRLSLRLVLYTLLSRIFRPTVHIKVGSFPRPSAVLWLAFRERSTKAYKSFVLIFSRENVFQV